jgi:hypothetical protein
LLKINWSLKKQTNFNMTNIKSLLQSLLAPLAAFILIAASVFIGASINTHAQTISLEPLSIDRSDANERGWFLYNVQPGSTIEDTLVVRNQSAFDAKVQLNANDATVSTDGSFSLLPNEVENNLLGSWVSLDTTELTIGTGESIGVPFTIEVPADAQSGEYAGGLSAIIIDETESGNAIGARLRLGVRMYLTVDGDLQLNPSISSLNITSPQDENFEERLQARGSNTPDSMGFYLTAQELGNIYSKSRNTVTFTLPDGTTETKTFTRNYVPGQPATDFYVETGLPYQVGDTKVVLEYEASPFIDNKPGLNSQNTTGTVEYTLTMTQEDLDTFIETYNRIKEGKNSRRSSATNTTPAEREPTITIGEGNIAEVTAEDDEDSMNMWIVYGLVAVIALLVIALVVIVLKNNKKEPETKDKETKSKK